MTAILRVAVLLVVAACTVLTSGQALTSGAGMPARPSSIPKDLVSIGGCVPGMGAHWISTKAFPFGPIYGSYRGRLVFVEYMIAQKSFEEGKSWTGLKVPAGAKVDHMDIEFLPKGHEGYEIPHYDIHVYFVPHETHMKYGPSC